MEPASEEIIIIIMIMIIIIIIIILNISTALYPIQWSKALCNPSQNTYIDKNTKHA